MAVRTNPKREVLLTVRLSEEENERVEEAALERGVPKAIIVRDAIRGTLGIGKPEVPKN